MVLALVDCNSFYASCQIAMAPALRKRPVCVMSNNDGAIIARSPEAKALGVKMSQSVHELRDMVTQQGLILLSANFALYGDFHRRLVQIIREVTPRFSVYSVDEVFIDLTGIPDRVTFAHALRTRILRWLGLPVCVGLGFTHGLAKSANKLAKGGEGVVDLCDPSTHAGRLASLPICDVWGVGQHWCTKLMGIGITNALELRDAPGDLILEKFGVVLRRTQRELQGMPCQALQLVEPDRKQIVVSRSFGERVDDHAAVTQAIATFTAAACAKMRAKGLVTSAIMITAMTDVFRPELQQHCPSRAISLPSSTGDTTEILRAIRSMTHGFLKAGCAYKRAGVVLTDLARPQHLQADLFSPTTIGKERLMQTLDAINHRFGRHAVVIGATGCNASPKWQMRQRALLPASTTRYHQLPVAIC